MTTASASPSGLPGANGECGYQHGMAPCLPMDGRTCCSINGFCGSNETYCFVSNGCQYGCVDPASFYSTLTTILTISTQSPTDYSSIQTTLTSKTAATTSLLTSSSSSTPLPTTNAEHSGGIKGGAKIGAIAGGAVGGVLLFAFLVFCFLRWQKARRKRAAAAAAAETAAAKAAARNRAVETTQARREEPVLADPALIMRPNSRPLYSADRRT